VGTSTPLVIHDHDVTCTPTLLASNSPALDSTLSQLNGKGEGEKPPEENNDVDHRIYHPGPIPRNIYNRGLYQNWMEVIFPLSLRPENIAKEGAVIRSTSTKVMGTTKVTTTTTFIPPPTLIGLGTPSTSKAKSISKDHSTPSTNGHKAKEM
jgi:hypothetical protein